MKKYLFPALLILGVVGTLLLILCKKHRRIL